MNICKKKRQPLPEIVTPSKKICSFKVYHQGATKSRYRIKEKSGLWEQLSDSIYELSDASGLTSEICAEIMGHSLWVLLKGGSQQEAFETMKKETEAHIRMLHNQGRSWRELNEQILRGVL